MTEGPKTNEEIFAVLINKHPVSVGDEVKIQKLGAKIPIGHEYLAAPSNMFWFDPFAPKRKVKSKKFIPASKEERRAFKKWKKAYDDITEEGRERGWYSDGYEGPEIDEPSGTWEYEYEEENNA